MTVSWPITLPLFPNRGEGSGAPEDGRVAFKPDRGPALFRRGGTAEVQSLSVQMPLLTNVQFGIFAAWFDATLKGGVLPFAQRHPVTKAVGRYQIAEGGAYRWSQPSLTHVSVGFEALRLPGSPWWAAYVEAGRARVPDVVADYAGSVFGVAELRGLAAAVAAVSGTFDLYTTTTLGVTTLQAALAVSAGGIPASAPLGVAKIVGFRV